MPDPDVTSNLVQSDDAKFDRILNEVGERLKAGDDFDVEDLLRDAPEVAERIRKALPGLKALVRLGCHGELKHAQASEADIDAKVQELGDYRILGELGRGGMGVVYEAEQISMNRKVALKVLPFAALLDERQLQRFKNEARAAGGLHHPNIVPVFSVGTERGVHYYAMQYIEGPSLAEMLQDLAFGTLPLQEAPSWQEVTADGNANDWKSLSKSIATNDHPISETRRELQAVLSTQRTAAPTDYYRSVARWGQQAAEALAYAHEHGVLHRDIKPGNLLLDGTGKLWVTDFGLARLESDASMTMTGDLVGTLRYMAPEQALAKRVLVDHRADIYSLGVTLYELTTTQPAFSGQDREEILHKIAFEDPVSPTKVDSAIPRDLETIILKAASKAPQDRYGSAQELADDLGRFLRHEPIAAKPPSILDGVRKWARRHPAVTLSTSVALVIVTIASLTGIIWSNHKNSELAMAVRETEDALRRESTALDEATKANLETERALQSALASERQAKQNLYLAKIRQAYQDWQQGQVRRMFLTLAAFGSPSVEQDLRGWEWYALLDQASSQTRTFRGHTGGVLNVALSPDHKTAASAGDDTVRLWQLSDGARAAEVIGFRANVRDVDWHPVDDFLAVACSDNRIRVWDVRQREITRELTATNPEQVSFNRSGQLLACCERGNGWKVYDWKSGKVLWSKVADASKLAWLGDGQRLVCCAAGEHRGVVEIWNVSDDTLQGSASIDNEITSVACHPNGEVVAVGDYFHTVHFIEAEGCKEIYREAFREPITCMSWSDNGELLAVGQYQQLDVYDWPTKETRRSLAGHWGTIAGLAWDDSNQKVVSASVDRTIRVWELGVEDPADTSNLATSTLSPDGQFVAEVSPDANELLILSAADKSIVRRCAIETPRFARVTWTPDSRRVCCNAANGSVDIWPVDGRQEEIVLKEAGYPNASYAINHDGSRIAIGFYGADSHPLLAIYGVPSGDLLRSISITDQHEARPSWSPDGGRLATSGRPGVTVLWDAKTGEPIHRLYGHGGWVGRMAWSPDGDFGATGGADRQVLVWNTRAGTLESVLQGHTSFINEISWSHDGQRLLTTSNDGSPRLWNPYEGVEILELTEGDMNARFDRLKLRLDATSIRTLDTGRGLLYARSPNYLFDVALAHLAANDLDSAEQVLESLGDEHPMQPTVDRLLFSLCEYQLQNTMRRKAEIVAPYTKLVESWIRLSRPTVQSDGPERHGVSEFQSLASNVVGATYAVSDSANTDQWKVVAESFLDEFQEQLGQVDLDSQSRQRWMDAAAEIQVRLMGE